VVPTDRARSTEELRNAVHEVASVAKSHLDSARAMAPRLVSGAGLGSKGKGGVGGGAGVGTGRGIGGKGPPATATAVFLPAVATGAYLDALEVGAYLCLSSTPSASQCLGAIPPTLARVHSPRSILLTTICTPV